MSQEEVDTYTDYIEELMTRLNDLRLEGANALIKSKHRSKHYYDRNAKEHIYEPGDLVYAIKEPRKNKLDVTYTGPYRIVDILDKHNVILEKNNKRILKHMDKIKQAHLPYNEETDTD